MESGIKEIERLLEDLLEVDVFLEQEDNRIVVSGIVSEEGVSSSSHWPNLCRTSRSTTTWKSRSVCRRKSPA